MARCCRATSFLDELPRSGYGKVTKLVRDALYERGCLDRAPELAR